MYFTQDCDFSILRKMTNISAHKKIQIYIKNHK